VKKAKVSRFRDVDGKPLAEGVPAADYGFTQDVRQKFEARLNVDDADAGGIGGTLAGNPLSGAAMKETLEHVLNDEFYLKATRLQEYFIPGTPVTAGIKKAGH
jgi:glutamate-1-semialdehyde 2,1-aminomutase